MVLRLTGLSRCERSVQVKVSMASINFISKLLRLEGVAPCFRKLTHSEPERRAENTMRRQKTAVRSGQGCLISDAQSYNACLYG
jgi:hypothetical protein